MYVKNGTGLSAAFLLKKERILFNSLTPVFTGILPRELDIAIIIGIIVIVDP